MKEELAVVLTERLQALNVARDAYERQRAIKVRIMDEAEEKLEADPDFISATNNMDLTKISIDQLEAEIKKVGLALYKANPGGGKSLAGGNVNIKEMTKASITDQTAAREWAQVSAPNMIILDEKAVIKHAKAVKDTVPLPFVEITEETQAQIASKLKFGG